MYNFTGYPAMYVFKDGVMKEPYYGKGAKERAILLYDVGGRGVLLH